MERLRKPRRRHDEELEGVGNPLSSYDVNPNTVSVSGLSSGGFMAAQLKREDHRGS
jgi:hypothetical protein